ncbi:MAG: hypothetical protein FIA99_04745 [Ruminiclostridium sp.]|nr:hypothetical protein [Ruminiclostridium sp.]
MGKLTLVIADKDENYLSHLGNYIMVHYSGRFSLHLFSSFEDLSLFLESAGKHADILLYGCSFPEEAIVSEKVHTMIRLSENNTSHSDEDANTIFKYRHTERLIQDILHTYSKSSAGTFIPDGKASAGICAVHSASGGTGKTCIAAGLSMLAARRGLKCLYLNFESTPSTSFYFKGQSERSLSDVIYYLKERGDNLAVKLESGRCCDPASGVHYFLPPESACEFDELTGEDIDLFIGTIRSSSLADIIFIDLPSGLSRRNKLILKSCDKVIEICEHRAFSRYMKGVMEGDPGTGGSEETNEFSSRTFHILNKYSENASCDWYEKKNSGKFCCIIGDSEKLRFNRGEKLLIDLDQSFSASLGKLLDLIAAGGGVERCRSAGGVAFV